MVSQILFCPLLWALHGLGFVFARGAYEAESGESEAWLDREESSLGWVEEA